MATAAAMGYGRIELRDKLGVALRGLQPSLPVFEPAPCQHELPVAKARWHTAGQVC